MVRLTVVPVIPLALYSAIRLGIVNQRVTAISDYWHAPWILESATDTVLNE
jgi:hypothetical protein